ncbi:MAG: PfkB family carbohydrate kinase [Microbacterium arborescens]
MLHTGQAIVDIVLGVAALPPRGGDVYAESTQLTAGGGFNVMAAARRDGAEVVYLGTVGDGPFGRIVGDALAAEDIAVGNTPVRGVDTGFSVAIVDAGAERTFVSSLGAEGRVDVEHLRSVTCTADDVVYVTGYSMLHERNRAALLAWTPTLPAATTIVFDPSPLIADIPDEPWRLMVDRASIWTLNTREAGLAARRFGDDETADPAALTVSVDRRVRGTVVVRDSESGAYVSGESGGLVAPHRVSAVDTNGAGDAHTGVLCAALTRGASLIGAVRRANVAAAIAVTRSGPATSPAAAEIDAVLAEHPGDVASAIA